MKVPNDEQKQTLMNIWNEWKYQRTCRATQFGILPKIFLGHLMQFIFIQKSGLEISLFFLISVHAVGLYLFVIVVFER